MSDIPIEQFLPLFANTGASVAFLVPTPTGYEKSIMDATFPVRELLSNSHVHDYESQLQGPAYKVKIKSYFVTHNSLIESYASLYRPVTKKGDPRIWFGNLRQYCSPCNLLAILVINKELYVINLSNPLIQTELKLHGFPYSILEESAYAEHQVAKELLHKIQLIHNQGFLRSITPGDPGVGDTLENALGISRNNSQQPDYKGIELKTTRLTRNGSKRSTTRSTLFTKVPDAGMSYREIVENYGKMQIPRNQTIARLQLYETFCTRRTNAYDLILEVDAKNDQLNLLHQTERIRKYVSSWQMSNLRSQLLTKHKETFWVKAVSENRNGVEYFRYDKILHTQNPNASLLAPLFEADKITLDLAAHITNGKWRDHGALFKMYPVDFPLLFGEPIEYDLTKDD